MGSFHLANSLVSSLNQWPILLGKNRLFLNLMKPSQFF